MSDINVTVQDEIVNIDVIDTPVLVEVTNSPGPAGAGVAAGGTTGQVLAKASNTNYDTVWVNPSTGGVPYSGATGNVNLGEYELKAGQVTLDTSPTGTAAVGTIRWNDTTGTSETTLKGGNVVIKNGVDLVARVVNKVSPNTTLTKAAYQAVRVSGAQGQRLAIELAQANNDAGSADTIGLVTETIAPNQEGFIMTVGQLEGINTTGSLQGETWVDGDVLYLSPTTAGAVTNVKPTAVTGHIVVIGYVEYAHVNNGKIYVKVMNGWELDELHNVSIVTPTNNQGLFYNSSNSLWESKSITTALGYTPVPTTRNITINGVTYDLSADRTFSVGTISGSGASGQVTYWTGASAVSGSNNLFWDNANGRLGIGTNAPLDFNLVVQGAMQVRSIASAFQGIRIDSTSIRVRHSSTFSLGTNDSAIAISMFAPTNNVGINTTSDLGVRFGVIGDTLLRGSGNTSATTALTVQNSSSADLFKVRSDGQLRISSEIVPESGAQLILTSFSVSPGTTSILLNAGNFFTATLGATNFLSNNVTFNPTSGTGIFNIFRIAGTINQTGGANGITRGLYVNPTLTSAADFRAIETSAGNVLFGSNFFWDNTNGRLGIGTNAPSYFLDIASAQTVARFRGGVIFANNNISNVNTISSSSSSSFFWQGDGTGPAYNQNVLNFQSGSGSLGFHFTNTSGNSIFRIFTATSNVSVGSNTDLGTRLGVVGDTLLRGSGATSATTALTVQNSSSTNLFSVRNDGLVTLSAGLSANNVTANVTRCEYYNNVTNTITSFRTHTASGHVSFYNSVAIGTTNAPSASKLQVVGLPTSSAGLASGDVWNDGGTLKIV